MFNTVELDYTYYRMPTAEHLRKAVETGGPELTFSIKAHESLTHKVDSGGWRDAAAAYIAALEPLREAGKLEAVLLQFPFSFHYEAEQRKYLAALMGAFGDIPLAVEFRNADWCNNRVIEGLRKRGASFVILDEPELTGLPPKMDVVTAPLVFMRLHGRNGEAWWGSDQMSRYDYLYSEQELETVAERIKMIIGKAERLLIYFNNHLRGQAVKNAEMLTRILEKAGLLGGKDVYNGSGAGDRAS
jgi:uncharacterized protein YecE (DUF72 family)